MPSAIVIKRNLKIISFMLLFLFSDCLTYGQVNEFLVHDIDDISVSQSDSNKTGVFIFVKSVSVNLITNKLLLSLVSLEISEFVDTVNFEIFLIKINSNNSVCANKCMTINEYELPSFFNYEPYHIVISPGKNYLGILNERVDINSQKSISIVPNIKSKNSPFLHFKDYRHLVKLISKADYAKNYQTLKLQYEDLQEKLLFLQNQIDSIAKISPIIQQYLERMKTSKAH